MFDRLKKWFGIEDYEDPAPPARASALNRSGAFSTPPNGRPVPERGKPLAVRRKPVSAAEPAGMPVTPVVRVAPQAGGEIMDLGPGKNVLIRNKFRREDTGTHEKLTILDESIVSTGEETGIDPYNTGKFDRSRNWDKRFR